MNRPKPCSSVVCAVLAFVAVPTIFSATAKGQDEPVFSAADFPRLVAYGEAIHEQFDVASAIECVTYADQFFRTRGNEGYHLTLEHVRQLLIDGGFSSTHVTMVQAGPALPAWTPRRASLTLLEDSGPRVLHAFDSEADRDRVTLLVGSDSIPPSRFIVIDESQIAHAADVAGLVVLGTGEPWELVNSYVGGANAAGILTFNLEWFHQPQANPDAAQFGYIFARDDRTVFGFSLSLSAYEALQTTIQADGHAAIEVQSEVEWSISHADTLVATIQGSEPGSLPIVYTAHVNEPGANDNASGVGAALELALAIRRGVDDGSIPTPRRSIIFIWGQEIESTQSWIAANLQEPLVGVSLDMVGEDPEVVGAPFLIERLPDPGAIWLLPPDEHTDWGTASIDTHDLRGHFLTDLMLASAQLRAQADGPWDVRTNPYEGGSDHDVFLGQGVPAVLAWHFTDDAYHTTRDRLERVSGEEMRRVAVSVGAAGLSMALAEPEDLTEILQSVIIGADTWRNIVEAAAQQARDKGSVTGRLRLIGESWLRWYDEAFGSVPDATIGPIDDELSDQVQEVRSTWLQGGADWLGGLSD